MNHRKLLALALTACLTVASQALAQTSTTDSISVEHPWARATPAGAKTGAAYVTVVNHSAMADRLIGISTPMAAKAQLHRHIEDNGVMRMSELPTLDIGPGASVIFKPGGLHIMLVGLRQPLKEGNTLQLTLEFEKAGKIDVRAPIAKAGASGEHDMSGMH